MNNLFNTAGLHPHIAAMVESHPLFSKLPTSLLGTANTKTVKGEKIGVLTGILYLSPADSISPKLNICPYADIAGCKVGCLNTAGRGAFNSVQRARIRKTLMWSQYHYEFMGLLERDIERLQRKASRENMTLAIRLNGTSDIQWEKQRLMFSNIFDRFPTVQFYDYTKIPGRTVPANYHLTFSYSGVAAFQPVVAKQLRHNPNTNLAVVFHGRLPEKEIWAIPSTTLPPYRVVINGDASDVRYQDPAGVIVGLTAKGKAKNDTSGFVVAGNAI
jgi:hypothetical protein